MNSASVYLAAVMTFTLVSCGRFEGAVHFLREEPRIEAIPGVYALAKESRSEQMLRSMGYKDVSVNVQLNDDGSFLISRMPDCWMTDWSDSQGGYDGCQGTWSVYKSYSVYTLSLQIQTWTEASTFVNDRGPIPYEYTGALTLTKEDDGYGLAIALAAGDKGYIYFRRKRNG